MMLSNRLLRRSFQRSFHGRRFLSSSKGTPPPSGGGSGRGPVSWTSLVAIGLVGAGVVAYYNFERDRKMTQVVGKQESFGKAMIGGEWTLADADGQIRTDKDFLGKYMLVYFGFTFCPDICPNELVKIGRIVDRLNSEEATKDKVTPVIISIDPRRDTVGQLDFYRKDFNNEIVWLTGTPNQVKAAAKAYRVFWSKALIEGADEAIQEDEDEEQQDYQVDHSVVCYLMGPDGKHCQFFTSSVPQDDVFKKIKAEVSSGDV
eukprot:g3392.t1